MGSLERYRCGSGRAPTSSGNLSEDTLPVPSRTTSVQVRSRTDFFSGDTGADAAERRSPFGRRLTPPSDDSVSSQAASARIWCKTIPSQMVSAQVRPRTDPFGAGISADTVEQRYLRGQLPCCDFAKVCLLGQHRCRHSRGPISSHAEVQQPWVCGKHVERPSARYLAGPRSPYSGSRAARAPRRRPETHVVK